MAIYVGNILKAINLADEELDVIIQEYLDTTYVGVSTTVIDWRISNYKDLRQAAYPDPKDYLDAEFKIRTGVSGGQAELDVLDAQKAAIKIRFPKEGKS
ncbi:MAG: hypothetical protein GY710_09095 [Desulfobacteraceae bacterium]|nr:hypothetical protein [Desulfobacteraceae bacterium]